MSEVISLRHTSIQRLLQYITPWHAIPPPFFPRGGRICSLPDEMLVCILSHMDSIDSRCALACTSRRLYRLASTPQSMALWLLVQFGKRLALYYAVIAMPQRCNDTLITTLLRMGADLPRYLVQTLVLLSDDQPPPLTRFFSDISLSLCSNVDAIRHLPSSGRQAILDAGLQRYGEEALDDTYLKRNGHDFFLFMESIQTFHASDYITVTPRCTLWKTLIDDYAFIPASVPFTHLFSHHGLLRLAESHPAYFAKFSPIFDFDTIARCYLWMGIIFFLFEVSFIHTSSRRWRSYDRRLEALKMVVTPQPLRLVDKTKDQELFCKLFMSFLSKYPPGYCTRDVMSKMLQYLVDYIHPSFSIHDALLSMFDIPTLRPDIRDGVAYFLVGQSQHNDEQ